MLTSPKKNTRSPIRYVSKLALKHDICYSTAAIRNSSTHISRNRRHSEGKRNTRITCNVARSGSKLGGGALWCAGSWGRIDPRRKRRSGLLRRRNNFPPGRVTLKRTASTLICCTTINLRSDLSKVTDDKPI